MKKLFLLFIILSGIKVKAQSAVACGNAQNICTNPNFLFQGISGTGLTPGLNISDPNTNPQTGNGGNPTAPANSGCLMTNGPGPQWLVLTVSVAGNLGFIFGAPGSTNPQVGLYDWAMWPYTPSTCANIFNNTLPPVACNWNATSSGGTGMGTIPTGGNSGNYQPSLPVTAGQQFLILISNYSGVTTPVSFTSTGTASLTCGFNTAICAGQTTTIGPIGFVPTTGNSFTLMPGGLTNTTGTFNVTPPVTTIYTITGNGLNAQNTSVVQTSTSNIVVNPQPAAAPTVTQSTCTNSLNAIDLHVTFTPQSPVPSYTISWSSLPASILSTSQQTATGIGPNPYTVTVTAAGGCSVVSSFTVNPVPAPATFTFYPYGPTYSVTCAQPTLFINASDPSLSYTWTNGPSAPIMDDQGIFTTGNIGNWTVTAINPANGCTATHTFVVGQNFVVPSSVVSPSFQNITCLSSVITVTATSNPSVNITHYFYSAQGGTATSNGILPIYSPPIGTHTHCIVNNLNGCSSCSTFTVASSDNFPLLSVASSQNFTLGCSTHSLISIVLSGSTTPVNGGVINYTLLTPASGPTYTFGPTPGFPNLTVPGTYTAAAQDNNNHCVTLVPFSIISNTAGPNLGAIVPNNLLDCYTPTTQLVGTSSNQNVNWSWLYPGPNGVLTVANSSLAVNTTTNVNSTLVANYTLMVTDNINSCSSTSVITIQQNLFPPKANIGATAYSITCSTPSVELTNNSTHGIPATSGYPTNQNVVAQLWQGPTPQTPSSLTATYYGFVPGTYTMTVVDLNNGCTSYTTQYIDDNRRFPSISAQAAPQVLDCGSAVTTLSALVSVTVTSALYNWIAPEDAIIVGSSTLPTLQVKTPEVYRVQVTNSINGCSSFGSYTVVPGQLNSNFAPDHNHGYAPLTVNFSNNSNSSLNTSSIVTVWTFGNGTQTTTPAANISPSTTYNQPGTYVVTIFTSKGACLASASDTIFVDIPSKLEIPNVFTPNGDNVNDIFFVNAANLTDINAKIYDRWGRMVYELVSSTGNIAWDGKNETGKEVAAGTYFYIIKATGKDGQNFDTKGTLTLFK